MQCSYVNPLRGQWSAFLKDLFVQNNETVTTPGLPGAETYLMILGSSESMENTL